MTKEQDSMPQEHPITPPPELVQQWWAQETYDPFGVAISNLATQAARWGADQELEACCEYMQHEDFHGFAKELRLARRPKPLSLKAQALKVLEEEPEADDMKELVVFDVNQVNIIRRALEQLDD